jgi:hypothetical protein
MRALPRGSARAAGKLTSRRSARWIWHPRRGRQGTPVAILSRDQPQSEVTRPHSKWYYAPTDRPACLARGEDPRATSQGVADTRTRPGPNLTTPRPPRVPAPRRAPRHPDQLTTMPVWLPLSVAVTVRRWQRQRRASGLSALATEDPAQTSAQHAAERRRLVSLFLLDLLQGNDDRQSERGIVAR